MDTKLLPAFAGQPELNRVYQCDALTLLRALPDASVDLILTDPPYGFEKTKADWDSNKAPFDYQIVFSELRRVIKARGAICCFAAPPFSADMLNAGRDIYRYNWYYEKARGSNFGNTAWQPFRVIEEILVFSKSIASANQFTSPDDCMWYFPQKERLKRPQTRIDKPHHEKIKNPSKSSHVHNPQENFTHVYEDKTPRNLLYAAMDSEKRGLHPTQKPTSICRYLIRTYTQPGCVILDPFCGSGTTAVAATWEDRRFICGDSSSEYVAIARQRLNTDFGTRQQRESKPLDDLPLFAQKPA